MGLVSSLRSGDEREKARPGQARSSGDGLKEQHKHAREHRTKIS